MLRLSVYVESDPRTDGRRHYQFLFMEIYYTNQDQLSAEATERVEFDVGSIRQVVAAEGGDEPDAWLVDPNGYQANGHSLRDSDTIRLIAYSKSSWIVYGTDGCNTCRHILDRPLETTPDDKLAALSEQTQLPRSLLGHIARMIKN